MLLRLSCDLCNSERIAKSYERFGEAFWQKLFTPVEIANVKKRNPKLYILSFSKMFAAKEAVFKLLEDTSNISWQDIEIIHNSFGAPRIMLHRQAHIRALQIAQQHLKQSQYQILISLSDDAPYALASATLSALPENIS